jgi:RNA polymerase sigma-70 factor, ECF subfamily
MPFSHQNATLVSHEQSGDPQRQVCPKHLPFELRHERTSYSPDLPVGYTVRSVPERSGDTGSFEELAMPHFDRLYNFARWLTADTAAAEDLVQETYMKALRGFSSFQQGTNFRAWIYRILRNAFLTSQTGLKFAASIDDEETAIEPATEITPESLLLARVDQQIIQRALEQLPANFREVILLCDLEEMSYHEIAQTLGIPIGTVMSRLARARKSMRVLLGTGREAAQP